MVKLDSYMFESLREKLGEFKRAIFSPGDQAPSTARLGREDYQIDDSHAHYRIIHDGGKKFALIEHGAVSTIQEAFRMMIEESEKIGGGVVVADVNGRVVVATYSMSVEQVEGIYRSNCKTVADAYAQIDVLRASLRQEIEEGKAGGAHTGDLGREAKSPAEHSERPVDDGKITR